jgi:integrase
MIQFTNGAGKRRSFRLGKITKRQAEAICKHVEVLNAAKISNLPVEEETARWLAGVDGLLRKKLAAVGLINDRGGISLKPFLGEWLKGRNELVKAKKLDPDSLRIEQGVCDGLQEFFNGDRLVREITEGDAADYRNWLLTSGSKSTKKCGTEIVVLKRKPLAESTTRKHCSIASKIFRYAMKKRMIDSNPFEAVPKANLATTKRASISTDDALKVMEQLPNTEWKLLFALSRWGGLRVGSEVRRLRWCDVLWDEQRILIHSHKTRRYAGHEQRIIPMFPELVSLLEQRFEEAGEGETLVIPFLVGRTDASLRKILLGAIKRAGLAPWPILWHSMRKARQNELERSHPSKAVCYWLGNSRAVADKHYLQVLPEDYARATVAPIVKTTAETVAQLLQK